MPDVRKRPQPEDAGAGEAAEGQPGLKRLHVYMRDCDVGSRRGCEKLIAEGRVSVNGEVVLEPGTKVDPRIDRVVVDGEPISALEEHVYLMLNKPAGYITSKNDERSRALVMDLVPAQRYPSLFHVGRLDKDTTGLLLFMTDGELCYKLLRPEFHVDKRYEVVVRGRVSEEEADILRAGILIRGVNEQQRDLQCQPAKVTIHTARRSSSRVTCTICEGHHHQVKRMFKAIGHPVMQLHRASFGPLELGDLAEGSWRMLTPGELETLRTCGDW